MNAKPVQTASERSGVPQTYPFCVYVEWTPDEVGERYRPIRQGDAADSDYLQDFVRDLLDQYRQTGWIPAGPLKDAVQTYWDRSRRHVLGFGRPRLTALSIDVVPASEGQSDVLAADPQLPAENSGQSAHAAPPVAEQPSQVASSEVASNRRMSDTTGLPEPAARESPRTHTTRTPLIDQAITRWSNRDLRLGDRIRLLAEIQRASVILYAPYMPGGAGTSRRPRRRLRGAPKRHRAVAHGHILLPGAP